MSERVRLYVGALVFFVALPLSAFAQLPPPPPPPMPPMGRDSAPQKTGTARLSGRVTALDTGKPIRRAQVRASGQELREGKSVSTDADGRWKLNDLPGGRYSISVSKGGYVGLSYGQRRPFEAGRNVDLAEAQVIEKLDVALPRGSAITGKVVDEFGDPVTGARVSALRPRFVGGQRRLMTMGNSATTDDLGQYRIHGLAPGDYYVSAQQQSFLLGTSEDRTGYAQTFFPNALLAGEATRVSVAVGQEAQNTVIAMAPTKTATLSGTATTSDGKPIAQGMGFLRETSPSGAFSSAAILIRDGRWTVSGVVPGDYLLTLSFIGNFEQVAATGSTTAAQTSSEFIVQPLTVTGEDIRDVALVASAGGTASGRLKFEGSSSPDIPSTALVHAVEPSIFGASSVGRVRADGTFTLSALYGKRILRVSDIRGWTLKSVTLNGADITDSGFETAPGTENAEIEMTLTQQTTEISGTVTTSRNEPVTDFVAIIFPPDADRWGLASRYVKATPPDQTGRFVVAGLPPGSYLAVAVEYMEPGDETNPEFLEKLKVAATTVRVGEGEKKTLTLKLSSQQGLSFEPPTANSLARSHRSVRAVGR
jgi:hypothetical protein